MEREIEYLRQQIEYLNRMLESSLARISSLEMQVAALERRPVAIAPPEEREPPHKLLGPVEDRLVKAGKAVLWENDRRRRG